MITSFLTIGILNFNSLNIPLCSLKFAVINLILKLALFLPGRSHGGERLIVFGKEFVCALLWP